MCTFKQTKSFSFKYRQVQELRSQAISRGRIALSAMGLWGLPLRAARALLNKCTNQRFSPEHAMHLVHATAVTIAIANVAIATIFPMRVEQHESTSSSSTDTGEPTSSRVLLPLETLHVRTCTNTLRVRVYVQHTTTSTEYYHAFHSMDSTIQYYALPATTGSNMHFSSLYIVTPDDCG